VAVDGNLLDDITAVRRVVLIAEASEGVLGVAESEPEDSRRASMHCSRTAQPAGVSAGRAFVSAAHHLPGTP
jgi:hypothetical protein